MYIGSILVVGFASGSSIITAKLLVSLGGLCQCNAGERWGIVSPSLKLSDFKEKVLWFRESVCPWDPFRVAIQKPSHGGSVSAMPLVI